MIDPEAIADAGARMALQLAVACGDRDAVDRIVVRTLEEQGSDHYGWVCDAALTHVINEILAPVLEWADQNGMAARTSLRKVIAETPERSQ